MLPQFRVLLALSQSNATVVFIAATAAAAGVAATA